MVTERVRTLPTEPTEGEIAKSNPLLSFINIGQRGRNSNNNNDCDDDDNSNAVTTNLTTMLITAIIPIMFLYCLTVDPP